MRCIREQTSNGSTVSTSGTVVWKRKILCLKTTASRLDWILIYFKHTVLSSRSRSRSRKESRDKNFLSFLTAATKRRQGARLLTELGENFTDWIQNFMGKLWGSDVPVFSSLSHPLLSLLRYTNHTGVLHLLLYGPTRHPYHYGFYVWQLHRQESHENFP